jgi:translation initiation factor IF-3
MADALQKAKEANLDLVEIAPTAKPPVCRIMNFGKFIYQQKKKQADSKKKQKTTQVKEVKFRPGIEEHDFATKVRHARGFLGEGNKVKVTLMFRGRQIAHPELGRVVVQRVAQELADVAKIETEAKFEGKFMTMILAPK